ncbi:MAG: hypothetical protein Q4F79_04160 [Eubacteriales bacterium]|nr:hypothetical protein [Eubacteriales bacterium]
MSELTEMLKKTRPENLASLFLYGVGEEETAFENYEKTLEKSYDIFFDRLKILYPETDRNRNDLCDLVMDFTILHENVSFEAGMLIGFQLYKNMEGGYQDHKENDLWEIVQKRWRRC